jgi:hypothetical protein
MLDIKIKGIEKVQRMLRRLQNNIEELDGKKVAVKSVKDIDKKISEEVFKGV